MITNSIYLMTHMTNFKNNMYNNDKPLLTHCFVPQKCQRKEDVVPVQLESKEEEAVRAGHGGSPADVLVSPDEAEKKGSSADLLSPTSDDDDEEGYTFIVRRPGNSYGVSFGDDEDSHAWKRESSAGDSRSKCALKSSGLDCESRNLAIVRKGLFADDCCFENVRRNYSQAVRQVLEKANEWSCGSDALDKYRKLRQQKVSLENQAVGVSEDSESHQVIHGFVRCRFFYHMSLFITHGWPKDCEGRVDFIPMTQFIIS